MQYVRSISGSLSSTWNSINPATLSGAIDVVVVEQEDGSLACSPFHIRFGKFSLLRPYEKKVEFRVNGQKVDYPMKLGEGGEAFFVFETSGNVPEGLQTSPPVSPAQSPVVRANEPPTLRLPSAEEEVMEEGDVEPLELDENEVGDGRPGTRSGAQRRQHSKSTSGAMDVPGSGRKTQSDIGRLSPLSPVHADPIKRPLSAADFSRKLAPKLERTTTDSVLPAAKAALASPFGSPETAKGSFYRPASPLRSRTDRSPSPPPVSSEGARARAMNLSRKLWTSNISNRVNDNGDLMLDMTGFKSSDGEALHAEAIARQLLSEEIEGPYDIGALIGADESGNIWIYRSEEAKEAAGRKAADGLGSYNPAAYASTDAISDPGYHSDDARSESEVSLGDSHIRRDSDSAVGLISHPSSPGAPPTAGDPNKNYAKTLRLTSDQLKTMDLKRGANAMAFTVNRATCHATLWYWHHSVPIVISDIDGTITKSDVLGHVLNSIGRDWTHQGVAKLYTDIAGNGYNFLYLTSRSVGQADTTRAYLKGVVQDGGFRLPEGPVILSPDRTIAALRREVYLRKPEIFKMACLRDIMALFSGHGGATNVHSDVSAGLQVQTPSLGNGRGKSGSPFYAGFGNRLTDALSYRSVNIPSTRIFTINSNSEVSLDLLSLNKYKMGYGTMREIVDHYFPPVGLLVKGGGEEFTDFNYWRQQPLNLEDFTDSEDEAERPILTALERTETVNTAKESLMSEDEAGDEMLESYLSDARGSLDEQSLADLSLGEDLEMTESMLLDEEGDGDDEFEVEGEDERDDDVTGLPPVTPEERGDRQLGGDFEDTPRAGGSGKAR